jgi:GT2 family glycosyltransferase
MTWTSGHAVPGNRWDLLSGVLPAEPPAVSVIVAHYRQPRQLARTLHALRRQDHPQERLEIIVADDGSPEAPLVNDGAHLVRQDDRGFRLAAARNLGAARATGDILVFLDADTTPEPTFIRELVRLPAVAPDCVTVGRRRHADLDDADPTADIERVAPARELPEPAWLRRAYRESRDLLDADDRGYRHLIGAVLACSRRFFDDIGGFDESFTAYGGEDWEWAYRAWIGGAVFAHVPTAVAWHDGPDAGGRTEASRAAKDDEAIRLADLIPLPGSRGHGLRPQKVDIAVVGPPRATRGQAFVSLDSVLAAVPGAEAVAGAEGARDSGFGSGALDRVRLRIDILRPVRVAPGALAAAVSRVESEGLGELVLSEAHGIDLLRISSMRARARCRRWGRDDLFARRRSTIAGVQPIDGDVDLEAYLGGWG